MQNFPERHIGILANNKNKLIHFRNGLLFLVKSLISITIWHSKAQNNFIEKKECSICISCCILIMKISGFLSQKKKKKSATRHIIQYIQIGFQFISGIVICPLIILFLLLLRLIKISQNSICQSVSEVSEFWRYAVDKLFLLGSEKTGEVLVALLIKLRKKGHMLAKVKIEQIYPHLPSVCSKSTAGRFHTFRPSLFFFRFCFPSSCYSECRYSRTLSSLWT